MQLNGIDQGAGAAVSAAAPRTNGVTQSPAFTHGNGIKAEHIPGAYGFRKAIKSGAKARVAFMGVSGSGKSYTMLVLARALAGPEGKIACVDTEHGSLKKYAHSPACPPNCIDPNHFDFDVDEPDSYSTEYLLAQLTYAEQNGYAVFCTDSLSHFWMGRDGALEFVDNAKKRTRDQMEGWKMFRPHEREMVDRFIASPCHIIVTMRVKTDYEEAIVDGKKKRIKVGLAPVQRDGLEYEFDLVCSMDDENNLLIDKTRCPAYSQPNMRVIARPSAKYFGPMIEWLSGPVIARPARPAPAPTQYTTDGHPAGTVAAAAAVAQQKIESGNPATSRPWTTFGEMKRVFLALREQVGEYDFLGELDRYHWKTIGDIRDPDQAVECYHHLKFLAERAEEQRKEVA